VSAIALRPYLPADLPVISDIFRDSIEELTQDDYDEDQRNAWAAAADDKAAFGARLAKALSLVATVAGDVAGFASLAEGDQIDLVYVRPDVARQGVATALVDALERLATARGVTKLVTNASDTARPFFEKRGYVAQSRNTVLREGEWLANTTMTKSLAANANIKGGSA
jgi:putative acetyltransferase